MQSALNLLHEQPQKRTQTVKLKNSGTQTTVTKKPNLPNCSKALNLWSKKQFREQFGRIC
jgi:hypothetical protein